MDSLYEGDCLEIMPTLEAEFVDSVITDPPYGLSFMGKNWDHGVPGVPFWEAALRVAKPGCHLLAFGGTRTYHRLMVAIEDAGWEIRDCIMWVYGSGFPKSHDVSKAIDKAAGAGRAIVGLRGYSSPDIRGNSSNGRGISGPENEGRDRLNVPITAPATDAARQWEGWGTALKPAWEPIIVARKPLAGTVAENVLKYGTGGMNIDGCRVAGDDAQWYRPTPADPKQWSPRTYAQDIWSKENMAKGKPETGGNQGRWPANLIHDGSDEVVGLFPVTESHPGKSQSFSGRKTSMFGIGGCGETAADSGSAARFFYCAKASRADRDGSNHPTMKPTTLMRYLCKLVTPPGGTILDPFMGSGSTGKAAILEGFRFIGIEKEAEYVEIAKKRIDNVQPLLMAAQNG